MIIVNKIKLRDKRLADALGDYIWRTDPELAQLDAVPVLTTTFSRYLLDYALTFYSCLLFLPLFTVYLHKCEAESIPDQVPAWDEVAIFEALLRSAV